LGTPKRYFHLQFPDYPTRRTGRNPHSGRLVVPGGPPSGLSSHSHARLCSSSFKRILPEKNARSAQSQFPCHQQGLLFLISPVVWYYSCESALVTTICHSINASPISRMHAQGRIRLRQCRSTGKDLTERYRLVVTRHRSNIRHTCLISVLSNEHNTIL
jgi:hypothetical protein